jgi:hypothetical protein
MTTDKLKTLLEKVQANRECSKKGRIRKLRTVSSVKEKKIQKRDQ